MLSTEAPIRLTNASPTVAVAPNSTGTATQISCEIVKTQEPFLSPSQVTFPGMTTGVPQHFVKVAPVLAKGFTVTGTQMDADRYPTAGQV